MNQTRGEFTEYLDNLTTLDKNTNVVDKSELIPNANDLVESDSINQFLSQQNVDDIIIDKPKVCNDQLEVYQKEIGDGVEIYNATDEYTLVYEKNKRKFISVVKPIVESDSRFDNLFTEMHQTRFQILFQRAKRHKSVVLWTRATQQSDKLVIQLVDALSISTKEIQHLIGNLVVNREGEICIQGSQLEFVLKLEGCNIQKGIYCDGHVVLVSGTIKLPERHFIATEIMHPPFDEDDAFDYFSGDVFGNLDQTRLELFSAYRESLLKLNEIRFWIVLSNVDLSNLSTLSALETLFQKIVDSRNVQPLPVGFVFMGDFSSSPFSFSKKKSILEDQAQIDYGKGFDHLSLILLKYKILLENCHFIFIPGPGDACICNELVPRMPILDHYTEVMRHNILKEVPQARLHFTTSPCRIRHLDKRLVFFPNSILGELLSSSLFISDSEKVLSPQFLVKMFVNTLIGQAHLYPISNRNKIISRLDSFQLLCPLPDFICLGDITAPGFVERVTDRCIIGNSGSYFSTSKTFFVYNTIGNKLDKYSL